MLNFRYYLNIIFLLFFLNFESNIIFAQDTDTTTTTNTENITDQLANDTSIEELAKIDQAQKDSPKPQSDDSNQKIVEESANLSKVGDVFEMKSSPTSEDENTIKPAAVVDRQGDDSEIKKNEEVESASSKKQDNSEALNDQTKSNLKEEASESEKFEGMQQETKQVEQVKSETLKKVELQESINALFDNEKSIKDVAIYMEELRSILIKMDEIVEKIRVIREGAQQLYHEKIDKVLDDLLLDSALKTSVRSDIDNIDIIEDKILAILNNLDSQYQQAADISIQTKKLNFDNLDAQKIEELKKNLQDKLIQVDLILKNVENEIIISFNNLISEAEKFINIVFENLGVLKKNETDFEIESQTLGQDGIKQDKISDLPEKQTVEPENIISKYYQDVKLFVKNIYIKFESFAKKMLNDIKNRAEELKKK